MTDYLEQLLRQAQDRERQEEGELTLPAPSLTLPPAAEADGLSAPDGQERPPFPRAEGTGEGETDPAVEAASVWRNLHRGGAFSPPGRDLAAPGGAAEELLAQVGSALPPEGSFQTRLSPPAAGGEAGLLPPRGQGGEDAPLLELYRQVRAGDWAPGGIARGGGVAVVREEVSPRQELTLGRLDRAMRRDSRRYDGGMSIY